MTSQKEENVKENLLESSIDKACKNEDVVDLERKLFLLSRASNKMKKYILQLAGEKYFSDAVYKFYYSNYSTKDLIEIYKSVFYDEKRKRGNIYKCDEELKKAGDILLATIILRLSYSHDITEEKLEEYQKRGELYLGNAEKAYEHLILRGLFIEKEEIRRLYNKALGINNCSNEKICVKLYLEYLKDKPKL